VAAPLALAENVLCSVSGLSQKKKAAAVAAREDMAGKFESTAGLRRKPKHTTEKFFSRKRRRKRKKKKTERTRRRERTKPWSTVTLGLYGFEKTTLNPGAEIFFSSQTMLP